MHDIYSIENLIVRHDNGEYITMLNPPLVREKKLTTECIELLKDSYVMRELIFNIMERTDKPTELKKMAQQFERLEYLQQEVWGFNKDKNYHRWYEVPKCSCSNIKNYNAFGTDVNFIEPSCVIHGE